MNDFEKMDFEMTDGGFVESSLAVKWSMFEIETDMRIRIVGKQDLS